MALRNRNPSEPRQDQPTKRIASKFMGMITGEPDSKVSSNFSTLIENMIDKGEYSTVRGGSKLYTTQRVGWEVTVGHDQLIELNPGDFPWPVLYSDNDIIYVVGTLPSGLSLATPYYFTVFSDGNIPERLYLRLFTSLAAQATGIGDVFFDGSATNIFVVLGNINGKCDHVKSGKVIWHIGNSVYISNKAVSSFTVVTNLLKTIVSDTNSSIIPFGDDAIMINKGVGIFRIILGESFYYMYQINSDPPLNLLNDIAATVTKIYGYLYMFSKARISGSGNRNRTTDGVVLQMETGTCLVPSEEKDYGEIYFDSEVGVDVTVDHVIGQAADSSTKKHLECDVDYAVAITHFPLYRTKDIGAGGSSSGLTGVGNRRDQPIWVEDVPVCKALIIDTDTDTGFASIVGASTNLFVRGDVGSRMVIVGTGGAVAVVTITSFVSISKVGITVQAGYTIPEETVCYACIGGFRVFKGSQSGNKIFLINRQYFGETDVDVSANTIALPNDFPIAQKVTVASDGTLPDPLVALTDYWVISVDSTHIALALSEADAIAGTKINLTTQGSGSMYVTTEQAKYNGHFVGDDKGRIVFVSDGTIRHIKSFEQSSVVFDYYDKLNVRETGDFHDLSIAMMADGTGVPDTGYSFTGAATYGSVAYSRNWNDTVPDQPQADGRVSLQDRIDFGSDLYVPRRMFRPMPNGDTGHISNGFMVVAERGTGEYSYCQTGDKPYCIGQYKYPEQHREVVGCISNISGYPFMALITMFDKTAILTLSSSQNVGRTEIGENIFKLSEFSVVDEKHGVVAWKTMVYKNNNLIFALTSDSAFRYFSGTAWSKDDLAFINELDAVSKNYLRKIDHNNVKAAVYSMLGGIKIWFQMVVDGVLTDMCLRYSTEPGEGYGWSLITGDDWVFPIDEEGVFGILDDNDVERIIVIDKNDYRIYEIDTFDRSTVLKVPALDKEDVEDTEITWKRRGIEHIVAIGSENKQLFHQSSYVNVEPVDKANRGSSGYTATGQRSAQELTLKTFFDGERISESARAEDFPEGGEVVFSGRKKEANKILMELSGTAGEINVTSMTDIFLIEEKAPDRDKRTMTEHTIGLALLAGKAVHICRSETLYNRVTQTDLGGGTVTKCDGPDGKTDSGFIFTDNVTCDNAALAAYTIVLWSKDANLFQGIAGFTAYGAVTGGWQMYYKTGANLGAAVVMEAGTKFDVRIYSKVLTTAQLALLREDTVDFEGKMLLPGFIGN